MWWLIGEEVLARGQLIKICDLSIPEDRQGQSGHSVIF